MKEKIKKILKPFLAVIIAGFIISFIYISLANRDTKRELIKLPEIFGEDYYDLESRISDLEGRVDDLEGRIDDLESGISNFKSCLRIWFSGSGVVEEDDLWYCAGKLP